MIRLKKNILLVIINIDNLEE